MRHSKLAKVLALGLSAGAALTLAVSSGANAALPPGPGHPPYGGNITFTYAPVGFNSFADAYAFEANGLIKINPTIRSTCHVNEKDAKFGLAVSAAPLVSASTPNTGCTYGNGFSPAAAPGVGNNNAKIAEANVLNGLVKVNGVDSECGVGTNGNAFAGSRIAYLNGAPIGSGYGRLILPNLLTVEYNSTEINPVTGEIANYALRVTLGKSLVVLGHLYTIGQQIVVGECSVTPGPASEG